MAPRDIAMQIELKKIIPARYLLRPVREDTLEFMQLMDSISDNGFLNSISVWEHPTRYGYYEVVDGMWRYSAAKKLDFVEIPCILKVGVSEDKLLELQIQANAISYETKPIEFAERMQKMIEIREDVGAPLSIAELCRMVGKSRQWVLTRLHLLNLTPLLKNMVREGRLPLARAVIIGRLRYEDQDKFAGTWEFRRKKKLRLRDLELEVGRVLNQHRNIAIGKINEQKQSVYRPRLQSMDKLVIELDTMKHVSQLIMEANAQSAMEGAKLMLEWVLNLDKHSREHRTAQRQLLNNRFERLDIIRRQNYEELKEPTD